MQGTEKCYVTNFWNGWKFTNRKMRKDFSLQSSIQPWNIFALVATSVAPQAQRAPGLLPVARHVRGSVTVCSAADGRPAALGLGVFGPVETSRSVAMFWTLFPCPRARLGIHLGSRWGIKCELFLCCAPKRIIANLSLHITQITFLTWTKAVVFMWRVSTRCDRWSNHSRWSAMDWVRSLLLCFTRNKCPNRRDHEGNLFLIKKIVLVTDVTRSARRTYPRQVVLQFDSAEANMLQFVNLLLQPVVQLLHHHQAFVGPHAGLVRHPGSQKHTFYSSTLQQTGLWGLLGLFLDKVLILWVCTFCFWCVTNIVCFMSSVNSFICYALILMRCLWVL